MTRRNMSEPEAFRFLQRQSQDKRMPMAKLAESIVQADEFFEPPSGGGQVSAGTSAPPTSHGHGPIPIPRHLSSRAEESL